MKGEIAIKSKNTSRILYIDLLRIISIFGVVLLHVSASFVADMYSRGVGSWWAGNVIDSATRWCVPIFLMVSGILMLGNNKKEGIIDFLRRRLVKVAIPLVFWSIVYILWTERTNIELNLSYILELAKKVYEGEVYIHLWYLYVIIGLYLVTPIIKPYIENVERSNILYFLSIWFVSNGIIGIFGRFTGIEIGVNLSFFHWSIGYYILGYFLSKEKLSKKQRGIIYSLGIIGLLATIFGTYILTRNNNGVYVPHLYSYFALNVMFMAISVFVLFKNINWQRVDYEGSLIGKTILILSNGSFGVYLIHLLVLDILSSGILGMAISPYTFNPIIGIPLVSVITFILSYIFVLVLQKIPFIKMIVPK